MSSNWVMLTLVICCDLYNLYFLLFLVSVHATIIHTWIKQREKAQVSEFKKRNKLLPWEKSLK